MARKKFELKRIENKNARQVTLSKRKAGLQRKAQHLSILCDVDVAVIIISSPGNLFEYCTGGPDSMERMISKHQQQCLEDQGRTTTSNMGSKKFQACNQLLNSVARYTKMLDEGPNEQSVTDLVQLEVELMAALLHTQSKKRELMMKNASTLHVQENKSTDENQQLMQQSVDELVLRGFNHCVIDEVDSIIINEARTPLIISGPAEKPSEQYYKAAKIASRLYII
ncbi:hypothetical protein L1887_22773 [Cichorium endivia]|nr:hypothetical protein L1887_22773 [Cichorium endivia]